MADYPTPPSFTPPTAPLPIQPIERPRNWPTTVGVISIVLGGLGALSGCWGIVSPMFMGAFLELMPPGQTQGLGAMTEHVGLISGLGAAGMVVATLLLIAGIGMVRRRPWSVSASRWWAVLKMLFVVVQTALGAVMQKEMIEEMTKNDPNVAAMGTGFMSAMFIVGYALGLLWGWAYPIFLLIWLSRGKVKEEVASWPQDATAPPPAARPM